MPCSSNWSNVTGNLPLSFPPWRACSISMRRQELMPRLGSVPGKPAIRAWRTVPMENRPYALILVMALLAFWEVGMGFLESGGEAGLDGGADGMSAVIADEQVGF